MPGDGDCFLHCISVSLSSFLTRENSSLTSYLKSIGTSIEIPEEEKKVLRRLIVQEFMGPNWLVYEPLR